MASNHHHHRTPARFGFLEVSIACLIGGFVVLFVVRTRPPRQSTSWDDYNRVVLGMGQNDVESILGKGTDHTPIPANDVFPRVDFHLEERHFIWTNGEAGEQITVHFLDGWAIHKCYWKDHKRRHLEPDPWDCEWDHVQKKWQKSP